jgi:hypothetical protein
MIDGLYERPDVPAALEAEARDRSLGRLSSSPGLLTRPDPSDLLRGRPKARRLDPNGATQLAPKKKLDRWGLQQAAPAPASMHAEGVGVQMSAKFGRLPNRTELFRSYSRRSMRSRRIPVDGSLHLRLVQPHRNEMASPRPLLEQPRKHRTRPPTMPVLTQRPHPVAILRTTDLAARPDANHPKHAHRSCVRPRTLRALERHHHQPGRGLPAPLHRRRRSARIFCCGLDLSLCRGPCERWPVWGRRPSICAPG